MPTSRDKSTIDTLVIHCADTPNGRSHTAEDIDQWHGPGRIKQGLTPFRRDATLINGHAPRLLHIGYHFVIRTNGVVEVGRRLIEVGAHARGYNQTSIGTCLIGRDQFTYDQWETLANHVTSLQRDYSNLRTVFGHNRINSHKSCPGFDVALWLRRDMRPLPEHIYRETNP